MAVPHNIPEATQQIRASRFRQRQIPQFFQNYRSQIAALTNQAAADAAKQQSQLQSQSQAIEGLNAQRQAGVSGEVAQSLKQIQGIQPSAAPDVLAQQASAARQSSAANFRGVLGSQGLATRDYFRARNAASFPGQIQAMQAQAGQTGALRAQRTALRQQAQATASKMQHQQQLQQQRLGLEQSRLDLQQKTASFNQTLALNKYATSRHQGAERLKQHGEITPYQQQQLDLANKRLQIQQGKAKGGASVLTPAKIQGYKSDYTNAVLRARAIFNQAKSGFTDAQGKTHAPQILPWQKLAQLIQAPGGGGYKPVIAQAAANHVVRSRIGGIYGPLAAQRKKNYGF